MECGQIVGQFAAEFVNARDDQFPVGAIFQAGILANFFVVFVPGQVHTQNCVVVIGAGELCGCIRDQHLDQFIDIDTACAYYLHADARGNIAVFDDCAFSHNFPPHKRLKAGPR